MCCGVHNTSFYVLKSGKRFHNLFQTVFYVHILFFVFGYKIHNPHIVPFNNIDSKNLFVDKLERWIRVTNVRQEQFTITITIGFCESEWLMNIHKSVIGSRWSCGRISLMWTKAVRNRMGFISMLLPKLVQLTLMALHGQHLDMKEEWRKIGAAGQNDKMTQIHKHLGHTRHTDK